MSVCAIVLAAGKGTRMKSSLAKVLHPVFYKPMVGHVVELLQAIAVEQTLVVVGHQRQAVEDFLRPYGVGFVEQQEQLGTGHAVAVCQDAVDAAIDTVLILCGDTPLLSTTTVAAMLHAHEKQGATVTLLTTEVENPNNYGRIVSDELGGVARIVEEKDASPDEKTIREINAGVYCVDRRFLFAALARVDSNNAQGEIYLTDIVAQATEQGLPVGRVMCPDSSEVLGVNSRHELSLAHDLMQDEFLRGLNDAGVSILRPATVAIHPSAVIGNDTVLEAGVSVAEGVVIGRGCSIGARCYLRDCRLGDDVRLGPGAMVIGAEIKSGESIGPGQQMVTLSS